MPRRYVADVSDVSCIDKLRNELTYTLTLDDRLEFEKHEDITQAIGIDIYFAANHIGLGNATLMKIPKVLFINSFLNQ